MQPDRRWTDADRELVVSVLWTRACQGGNAGPALQLQPAEEAPMHLWADAAAVLGALSGAGLLADPQELERLRVQLVQAEGYAREAGDRAAHAEAEAERLRSLVAELQQAQPGRWELPAGIEWDLVRWHCTRCGTRSTWIDTPSAVQIAGAVEDARRHHSDHKRWDAERLSATPPETAPCQCRAFPMHPTSTCPNHQTSAPPEPTGGEQDG